MPYAAATAALGIESGLPGQVGAARILREAAHEATMGVACTARSQLRRVGVGSWDERGTCLHWHRLSYHAGDVLVVVLGGRMEMEGKLSRNHFGNVEQPISKQLVVRVEGHDITYQFKNFMDALGAPDTSTEGTQCIYGT